MSAERLAPYALVLPGLFLGMSAIAYPVFEIVQMAVSDVSRFGKIGNLNDLSNFGRAFADPLFWLATRNTLIWTLFVVLGTILISVPVAIVLNTDFHGRALARILVMLPWSVSLSMMAIVWTWGFDGEIGYVNKLLRDVGLIDGSVYWLAKPDTAFAVVIFVGIIVSVPFTVTVLLGGLSAIPQDIYEAAATEGASARQQFTRLTLPLLRPYINIAIVLNVIYVFNSFPIIWVMTGGGGPSDQTHILVTYLYFIAFRLGKLGEAAAVSLVMFAVLIAFTALYVWLVRRRQADA
jgi:multiple sugar transport system permease protein